MLTLVNAPLDEYPEKLKNLRCTYCPQDSYTRRYWRSKQNVDVAYLINAVTSTVHTEYIMLLEDDIAFQPGFGQFVQEKLGLSPVVISNQQQSPNNEFVTPPPRPEWGRLHFGNGYRGIVLHVSDAKAYQQVHYHFFDEKPCDIMA